jgi:DNA-binding HxlR family transcriptional regulator/peroxiredoxin
MRRSDLDDADCGIAQALGVLPDWWSFLIVREIVGGVTRFDGLQHELGMSRRALTEHLAGLVDHGVLVKRPYSAAPPRHEYLLTSKGEGLIPVLIALQDWGDRHVMGSGALTATVDSASGEAHRLHELVGQPFPVAHLPGTDGREHLVGAVGRWTVVYFFPGAYAPHTDGYPAGWEQIPGTAGCTLESLTYREAFPRLQALGADVAGISTQRPEQQSAFAEHAALPFPLLADPDGALAIAQRLPTFRVAGQERYKRQTLLLGPDRVVRAVQAPVTDPAGSVSEMLQILTAQQVPAA